MEYRNPNRENEELLKTFLSHLPVAVAMFDREMRYLHVSGRWCVEIGVDRERVLGRSHYEVFPEMPKRWIEFHRRGLAGEVLRSEEDLFVRHGGRHAWLRWEIRPWGMLGGVPQGIVIFSEDITQRKEVEEALRASESRYRGLFEHSNEAIAYCKMIFENDEPVDFVYLDVNERFKTLSGSRDAIGKRVTELIPGIRETDPELFTIYGRVARTGRPEKVEYFIRARQQWGAISVFSTKADHFTIVYDRITERKRMESVLREQHDRLEKLVATAPGAIYAFRVLSDGSSSFPYTSPAFNSILPGLPDLSVDASPIFALLHPDDLERVRSGIAESARTLGPFHEICRISTSGRGEVWIEAHSIPEREPDGSVSWYGFITDVTEMKWNERELKEQELEIHQLNMAVGAAEEEAARRIARELHDDVAQSLAYFSLKVGTIAAAPSQTEELLAQLRSLQAEITKLSEGVRSISHTMHPSIIDDLGLSAALESLCMDFGRAEGLAIQFHGEGAPESVPPFAATILYRVCQEALRNVRKHSGSRVAVVTLTAADDHLRLTVADSGSGIDSKKRNAGVGMHSMRERVRLAGGTLSVDSRPDLGTKVEAIVPLSGRESEANSLSVGNGMTGRDRPGREPLPITIRQTRKKE